MFHVETREATNQVGATQITTKEQLGPVNNLQLALRDGHVDAAEALPHFVLNPPEAYAMFLHRLRQRSVRFVEQLQLEFDQDVFLFAIAAPSSMTIGIKKQN